MTSKLRSLLSTPLTPRSSSDEGGGSPFAMTFSTTPSGLSASPSFSDFSMGISPAEAEAESRSVQHAPPRVCTSVPASPMAFNGRPPAPAPRLSLDSLRAKGLWGTLAGEKSLPVAVPAPNNDKATAAADRRRREKTIDGLDMYTWSELVRSSSL